MEAGDKYFRSLHPQRGQDVLLGPRIGGGGQSDPWHAGKHVGIRARLPVLGPEFVTPLRDTMRLIHREQRQRNARKPVHRAVGQQPFRGDVKQV